MSKKQTLTSDLIEDCKRVGNSQILVWLKENNILLPGRSSGNLYELLERAIEEGHLKIEQLQQAVGEIEESSSKKIFLMQAQNVKYLEKNRASILGNLKKNYQITISSQNWITRKPSKKPTFIYGFWENGILKLKFSELHLDVEPDIETSQFIKTERVVVIVMVIDTQDGFVQLRLDNAGTQHTHKNDQGKYTEAAYEGYYKNLLVDIFPELKFVDLNLKGVANYILKKELKKFRITKGVTTITNNAKQTFATASTKADVRQLPEYEGAAASANGTWLTEDLTGYWTVEESEEELKKDLFMRISRKSSQIRVQRGCLEKELSYGLRQIREIQTAI